MGLVTREEEKRFPREREILMAESNEETKEENRSASIPTHTTARGRVPVDVVQRQEQPERRLAKRRKVVNDDEKELAHEVRRMDMDRSNAVCGDRSTFGDVNRSSGRHTGRTFEGGNEIGKSDFFVFGADTVCVGRRDTTDEDERGPGEGVYFEQGDSGTGCHTGRREGGTLPTSPVEEVRPEEGKKTSGEDVKTLEITFPEFLQDSVVPLLKYLDGKRGEYAVTKEPRFYVPMIRNMTKLKRADAVKREWESATELVREREAQLWEKETECKVLQLNLEKEFGRSAELEETSRGLRISNENVQKVTVDLIARLEKSMKAYEAASKKSERLIITAEKREKMHIEELAKLEARRAEEVRIAEELWGKFAEAKTAEEGLRSKILEIEAKCEMEFRRAEELSASLSAGNEKHEEEL
ncbi:hypothetical protein AXG93_2886s1170 [Marchantia polymorpha subsp. ruderalis]|uniref:Uncharacterized protein n=1 Tax=Marchantia polymorpha subsp. ruderalis TaxID=1480154 RepID=A0A176WNM0_MARPO|nr:hypothetical protein AXG93_2886s1170 [Marchantia polymorpha subsp. ruderalis]